jgi:hypothetical protein
VTQPSAYAVLLTRRRPAHVLPLLPDQGRRGLRRPPGTNRAPTPDTRYPLADETIIDAVRRATLERIRTVVADPSPFLTRSRLEASVPAADARSRYLDSEFEDVIAEAVAADRQTDPATDLQPRVIARAAWSAVCAAREVWLASEAKREPRALIHQAFDHLEHDLGQSKRVARKSRTN